MFETLSGRVHALTRDLRKGYDGRRAEVLTLRSDADDALRAQFGMVAAWEQEELAAATTFANSNWLLAAVYAVDKALSVSQLSDEEYWGGFATRSHRCSEPLEIKPDYGRLTMDFSSAIQRRQLLTFVYDSLARVVEPHCYGIDGKGHHAIRAYQVGGGSESGESIGWKLFHVSEMRQIAVLGDTFAGPRPGYKRGDKAFRSIQAQL